MTYAIRTTLKWRKPMSDTMPEDIYAWEGDTCEFGYRNGSWTDQSMDDTVVYIRTDLIPSWNDDMDAAPVGVWILIYAYDCVIQACWHANGYWRTHDPAHKFQPSAVTHWMYRPKPPKSGGEE